MFMVSLSVAADVVGVSVTVLVGVLVGCGAGAAIGEVFMWITIARRPDTGESQC